jgi:DnaJ domain
VNKEQSEKCRDLGALRQGDYDKAVKMLEKSLQLYPLPGVEALLAHAKTKKNSSNNSNESNNRETSNGGSSTHSTTTSNGTSNATNRRSSSTSTASSETQQNGSDGRAYTQDQVLIVKKVLRAKEGGRGAHYRVLDIPNTATESDIKKAYRKLSLKVHPDKVRIFY